jgi:hypothetical protein
MVEDNTSELHTKYPMTRRRFLKLLGASTAMAVLIQYIDWGKFAASARSGQAPQRNAVGLDETQPNAKSFRGAHPEVSITPLTGDRVLLVGDALTRSQRIIGYGSFA